MKMSAQELLCVSTPTTPINETSNTKDEFQQNTYKLILFI